MALLAVLQLLFFGGLLGRRVRGGLGGRGFDDGLGLRRREEVDLREVLLGLARHFGLAHLDALERVDLAGLVVDDLREVAVHDGLDEGAVVVLLGRALDDIDRELADRLFLAALRAAVRDRHRLDAHLEAVLRDDVDDAVDLAVLAAREAADVVRRELVARELRRGFVAADGLHLELHLDVHLREVASEVLERRLGDAAHELLAIVSQRLGDDGAVVHGRRADVVPRLRLPLVLDLLLLTAVRETFFFACAACSPLSCAMWITDPQKRRSDDVARRSPE